MAPAWNSSIWSAPLINARLYVIECVQLQLRWWKLHLSVQSNESHDQLLDAIYGARSEFFSRSGRLSTLLSFRLSLEHAMQSVLVQEMSGLCTYRRPCWMLHVQVYLGRLQT